MRISIRTRMFIAWVAVLAILATSLLPSFGQVAARAAGDQAWLEVCTAYGVERVAAEDVPESGSSSASLGSPPCVWCKLSSGCVLPSSTAIALPADMLPDRGSSCAPARDTPHPQFCATASRPRAPPAFS